MVTKRHIERAVRGFITENFVLDADEQHIPGAVSLTQEGVFDSMGVLEMVMFIEERFGFAVPDHETVPDNLDSVDRVVHYVSRRLNGAYAGE